MKQNRRKFIKSTLTTASGMAVVAPFLNAASFPANKKRPVCVFTKCLQFLDYEPLGETLSEAGFDGADLSVRDRGHVSPDNVKKDLPKMIKALRKSGIEAPMMVTDIKDSDYPFLEDVLGTASENGVRFYRMAYLNYNPSLSIPENLDLHKKSFERLEKINRKFNIHGSYQNHAGRNIGGPVWDLYWLVKDIDPEYLGVQYDIRHAVVEGGNAWSLGMKLLSPWIKTTAIKDFYWNKNNEKWNVKSVPLGEGMVDFTAYMKEYSALGITGPVTLHYEYDLGGANSGSKTPTMPLSEIKEWLKKDLTFFRNKLAEHKIPS
jgi:L-ribulose-5-phosphate 3-epimerase